MTKKLKKFEVVKFFFINDTDELILVNKYFAVKYFVVIPKNNPISADFNICDLDDFD